MPETVTVTGTFTRPDTTPHVGSVSFIPPGFIKDPTGDVVYQGPAKAVLDNTGSFSIDVVATDATGINPSGFTYRMEIRLRSGMQVKNVPLPKANPTVDVADLVDASQSSGVFVPVIKTVNGVGPDSSGDVEVTGGGGTAGVASFNTRTGDVSLTKADVTGTGLAAGDIGAATTAALTSEASTARAAEASAHNAADAAQATANAALPKAGGTMTGDILLAGNATANLNPTTLQQVNALISAAVALLVGGADTAHDTLAELQTLLNTDESTAAALATAVAGKLAKSANLSDLVDAVAARTNLGLGTAAVQNTSAFDAVGAAASALSSAQAFATAAITALGLGSASTHPASDFLTPSAGNAAYDPIGAAATRLKYVGAWTAATDYAVNDMVTGPAPYFGRWVCIVAHRSGASFSGWSAGNWLWVGGNGYGTATNKPSAISGPNGFVYFETDTLLESMIVSGAWQQVPGGGYGQMIAGPVTNANAIDLLGLGMTNTTEVDVGLSITVPTTTQNFDLIWTVPIVQATTLTALAEAAIITQFWETDNSNVHQNGGVCPVRFSQGSTASTKTLQGGATIITHHVAADSNKTYKLRAVTVNTIPANWGTLKINPTALATWQISVEAVTR